MVPLPTALFVRFKSGQVSAEKTGMEGEKNKKGRWGGVVVSFVPYMVLSSDQLQQENGKRCTATIFDKGRQTKFLPHRDPWDPLPLSRELYDCWY